MSRNDFIRKVNEILDEAERTEMFGSLEIEIRSGKPTVMRTTITDKLEEYHGEKQRANKFQPKY